MKNVVWKKWANAQGKETRKDYIKAGIKWATEAQGKERTTLHPQYLFLFFELNTAHTIYLFIYGYRTHNFNNLITVDFILFFEYL